jgi:hypothetical protein
MSTRRRSAIQFAALRYGDAHTYLSGRCTYAAALCRESGYQALPRGGEIVCRLKGERVELEGACVFYMEGMAEI